MASPIVPRHVRPIIGLRDQPTWAHADKTNALHLFERRGANLGCYRHRHARWPVKRPLNVLRIRGGLQVRSPRTANHGIRVYWFRQVMEYGPS